MPVIMAELAQNAQADSKCKQNGKNVNLFTKILIPRSVRLPALLGTQMTVSHEVDLRLVVSEKIPFGGGIPSKGEIDKAKDLRTSAESMLKFIGFDPRHGRRRLRPLYERSSQLEGQRRLGGGTRHLRR